MASKLAIQIRITSFLFQIDCDSPSTSGVSYTTSQVPELFDTSQPLISSSSSESESDFDLSDPEAELFGDSRTEIESSDMNAEPSPLSDSSMTAI